MEEKRNAFEELKMQVEKMVSEGTVNYEPDEGPTYHRLIAKDAIIELRFFDDDPKENVLAASAKFYFAKDADLEFYIGQKRFEIFEILEKAIWFMYQEFQNNDPVDFQYGYDSDHLSVETIEYTVICTDYLS